MVKVRTSLAARTLGSILFGVGGWFGFEAFDKVEFDNDALILAALFVVPLPLCFARLSVRDGTVRYRRFLVQRCRVNDVADIDETELPGSGGYTCLDLLDADGRTLVGGIYQLGWRADDLARFRDVVDIATGALWAAGDAAVLAFDDRRRPPPSSSATCCAWSIPRRPTPAPRCPRPGAAKPSSPPTARS